MYNLTKQISLVLGKIPSESSAHIKNTKDAIEFAMEK